MEEQLFYAVPKPHKSIPVRACFKKSADRLREKEHLLSLVLCTLLCAVTAFAIYFMVSALREVLYAFTLLHPDAVEWIYSLVLATAMLLLQLPLTVGYIRLSGLIAHGNSPEIKELFYYFTAPSRYRRALILGFLFVLSFSLSLVVTVAACSTVHFLYADLLVSIFYPVLAVLLTIPLYLISFGIGFLVLFLSGIWFPGVAIAIGNEHLSTMSAFGIGIRYGLSHLGLIFRFRLRLLARLLLSLLTVGVFWLLYEGQLAAVAYMSFSEEMKM